MPNRATCGEDATLLVLATDCNSSLSEVQKRATIDGDVVAVSCIMDIRGMGTAFEIIDHTADVGVIAYGADVNELFSNAALALFSLITEPESVEEKLHLDLEVGSQDRDSLLVEWLNELIYFFDVKHVLFKRFDIKSLTYNELKATCYGEDFNPMKHRIKIGVKAATYHMLRVDKDNGGYKAQIIFDI